MSKHVPRTFPRLAVRPYRALTGARRHGIYLIKTEHAMPSRLAARDDHADAMTVAHRLAAHMFSPGRLS